ncbi:MAG: SH3 domain protein [Psychromonas sp.]|uniref:TIGR04211 family SH3 domain-containing protein n=1 Tax=Psychromonas sp. TaxID=1884585 RepID=UPI0039E2C8C8
MKKFNTILGILSLTLCMNLFAATRYVSDELFIYLHSGPSLDYRIIGTLKVGEPVTTLQYDSKTKFMQVKTEDNKTGWVKNAQLQESLPAKTLLPEIKQQLATAQTKLANIAQENEQILQEQMQSITEKEKLLAIIEDLKAQNLELDLLQDTKDERIKMEWMMYGGSVLFFGLLIGLILPFLPRRKKNKNNW